MASFTFNKEEKIHGNTIFKQIVSRGNVLKSDPFRIYWLISENQLFPIQIAIGVPKRNFKLAYKRNYLKRRLLEIYRLNKLNFYDKLKAKNIKLKIFVVYKHQIIKPYNELERVFITELDKLIKKLD